MSQHSNHSIYSTFETYEQDLAMKLVTDDHLRLKLDNWHIKNLNFKLFFPMTSVSSTAKIFSCNCFPAFLGNLEHWDFLLCFALSSLWNSLQLQSSFHFQLCFIFIRCFQLLYLFTILILTIIFPLSLFFLSVYYVLSINFHKIDCVH